MRATQRQHCPVSNPMRSTKVPFFKYTELSVRMYNIIQHSYAAMDSCKFEITALCIQFPTNKPQSESAGHYPRPCLN